MSNVVPLLEPSLGASEHPQHANNDRIKAEQAALIEIVTDVLETTSPDSALDALSCAVMEHLDCHQVAIALVEQDELVLKAISQQAFVDSSSSESTLITEAMQEACDREVVIRWPVTSTSERRDLGVLAAHRALGGRRRSVSYCSVPLYHDQRLTGAMLLERRDGFAFTPEQGLFLQRLSAVLAPLLSLHLQTHQGILTICRERCHTILAEQFGTERPARRLVAGLTCVLVLAACLIPFESHISATAELVPLERRLITAPRGGFVESVAVVAGEPVVQGQLLATLDTRELELEAARSASEIQTAEVEFRAAMASFDRQASAVARSRLAQSRAQQLLVERQLDQSQLRAPIAGLVLSADPTNTLGAPVSRGETLFEIAPADGYEVHLLVDESDIRDVYDGQSGELSLRARPGEIIALNVLSVHPIAESGNGASRFRVRAVFDDAATNVAQKLRPGESGQARLGAGNKSLVRIFFGPVWERLTDIKWRWLG